MNKKFILTMMATLALSLTLAFSGCSNSNLSSAASDASASSAADASSASTENSKAAKSSAATESSKVSESSAADISATGDKTYNSVEEYLEGENIKGQVDSLNDSIKSLGMSVNIYADGSAIVYEYTLLTDSDIFAAIDFSDATELDALKSTFSANTDGQKEALSPALASIKDSINDDNVSIRIVCCAPDGTEIYSTDITE